MILISFLMVFSVFSADLEIHNGVGDQALTCDHCDQSGAPLIKLPCGHKFDGECLKEDFLQSHVCPECSTLFNNDEFLSLGLNYFEEIVSVELPRCGICNVTLAEGLPGGMNVCDTCLRQRALNAIPRLPELLVEENFRRPRYLARLRQWIINHRYYFLLDTAILSSIITTGVLTDISVSGFIYFSFTGVLGGEFVIGPIIKMGAEKTKKCLRNREIRDLEEAL